MTTKLDGTLPNISKNVSGNVVQFISPVTQQPIVTSFENGKLVVKEGQNTLTGEQAQAASHACSSSSSSNYKQQRNPAELSCVQRSGKDASTYCAS